MQFSLLGPLEVSEGNRPVRLGLGRQRNVLILLLLHRNEAVSSERLVDTLWGETPPPTAAKVLQNYVSQLRRALGDRDGRRLQTRGHGYALRVDDGELDLDRFERLVGEHGGSLAHDRPAEAAVRLREALALWRGPALADVAYEAFAQGEIARLEERRSVALEERIDADLALGRHADLVAELEALIAERPLREHLRGQRMLALYRCGRQAEALEAFRETRRLLVDEVGVEPGPELQRLHEAILRHDASLELELKAHELPREIDAAAAPALVGRERELAWLRERWERAQGGVGGLIVLVGEPGIGKTRLAAELAGEVHRVGAVVLYAAGGESSEAVVEAIRRARQATRPTLLVVDDADANDGALAARIEVVRELATKQVLTVVTSQGTASLGAESSLALDPLDADAVRRIALLYAPGDAAWDVPADELLEASRGVPGRVHEVSSAWARREATRRLVAFAPRAAAGRSELRAAEAQVAGGVIDLQAVHERADLLAEREAPVVCPFKGLASFDVADAKYFFGRERLVAELVARAVGAPLLGVVGPSGSGKSSVVHAGLLPALADGVLPGSDQWPQLVVRPGEHPMRELHSARFNADTDRGIVLVVDQFEELFIACRDEHERAAFIDTLVRAARGRHGGGVVLAVRADFYGRCAAYPALSKLLGANHVLVGPMRSDELHRAIELPARRVGLEVEPELVAALVTDVEGEPGALPLLSTALLELWQDRDGRRLRHATYERTGGVRGAVARMAEEAYGGLDVADQGGARRLLLRLADEGEGGAIVRRRVALAELEGQGSEDLARVLAALTERRLLTMSATTVEVAHEALLREWPRLRGWLEEDAQGRRTRRRLTDAAREWDERGRDAGELYRGARLAVALEWRDGREHELNATERAFLDAGRTAAGRAQRRLRLALAGIAALLAVAVIGAVLALHQRSTARTEARVADAQRVSVQALTEGDLDRSLLLARQGFALADSPITRANLLAALLRSPAAIAVVRGEGTALSAIDLAPNGRTLVVGGSRGGVEFFDAVTRRRIGLPATIGTSIVSLRFSPDGTRVAVAGYDRFGAPRIELLDAHSRRSLGDLDLSFVSSFLGDLGGVAFSPDSRALVADYRVFRLVSGERRYLGRWDARTGRPLGPPRPITSHADLRRALGGFIAGGTRLVTSSAADGSTVIRDARRLRPLHRFPGGGSPADVSADGRRAALVSRDGSARLVDLRTGASRGLGAGRSTAFVAMRFTPDSRRLVTAGRDGRLSVWDARLATPIATVDQHAGGVRHLAISPDGRTAYTADQDGSVIGWDLSGARRLGQSFVVGPQTPTDVAAVTPDGPMFAVAGDGGSVDVVDSRTLARTRRIAIRPAAGATHLEMTVAMTRDGRTMAAGTADGAVRFADVRSGRPRGPPTFAHVGAVLALAFSPDGRWLATSGKDSALYLWNVARQRPVSLYKSLAAPATSLSMSPDGTRLALTIVHYDGSAELDVFQIPRLEVLARVRARAGTQIQFSRDGQRVFFGDDSGLVWTLDTHTWTPRGAPLGVQSGGGQFALSPDERMVAITANDGTTQLWDVPSRRPIGGALPGVAGRHVSTAFVDRGDELVTLDENGRGYVWDVRPQSWAQRACAIAGRTLTRAEWHDALPERDYAPECAQQ